MEVQTPVHFHPANAEAIVPQVPQSDAAPIVGGRVELQLLTTLKRIRNNRT